MISKRSLTGAAYIAVLSFFGVGLTALSGQTTAPKPATKKSQPAAAPAAQATQPLGEKSLKRDAPADAAADRAQVTPEY